MRFITKFTQPIHDLLMQIRRRDDFNLDQSMLCDSNYGY